MHIQNPEILLPNEVARPFDHLISKKSLTLTVRGLKSTLKPIRVSERAVYKKSQNIFPYKNLTGCLNDGLICYNFKFSILYDWGFLHQERYMFAEAASFSADFFPSFFWKVFRAAKLHSIQSTGGVLQPWQIQHSMAYLFQLESPRIAASSTLIECHPGS